MTDINEEHPVVPDEVATDVVTPEPEDKAVTEPKGDDADEVGTDEATPSVELPEGVVLR